MSNNESLSVQESLFMENKLKIMPFQIIEMADSFALKRGVSTIVIPDKNAMIVVRVIQKALAQDGYTAKELAELFSAPARELVLKFIDSLIERRFIVPLNETNTTKFNAGNAAERPQDIFYWHFNKYQSTIAEKLNEKPWAFIGINELSKRLISAIKTEGKDSIIVIDDPGLRRIEFFDDNFLCVDPFWHQSSLNIMNDDEFKNDSPDIGFMVAATEFGSFMLLDEWNEYAIGHDVSFYPVVLQNMVGYAGPLVIPGNSACLECLKHRQNSNNADFMEKRAIEKFAFEGQHIAAYHNSMLTVLAQVAIFDLIKFSNNIQWDVGALCEIDMLSGTMARRKLIKAPRCHACSGAVQKPDINIQKQMTTDDAWKEIEQTVGHE